MLTLQLHIPVYNPHLVQISHGAHHLGKHASQQSGSKSLAVCAGHVEQIPARAVAEHKDGTRGFDVPGFQVHQAGVMDALHDLEFALQAHLDSVLGRAPSWAVLTNLDRHQRAPFKLGP